MEYFSVISKTMQHEAILYSLDPMITKQQLIDQEHVSYDQEKYDALQERTQEFQIGAIFPSQYTKRAHIKSQPYLVYYLWDISLLDKKILGIVGPRKMSTYGQKVLETLFTHAYDYELVTISGMAEGVDQLCHSLSMQHDIPTIAVLGGWLGRYSKRAERAMIKQIVEAGGLVLSEFRLGDQPTNYSFPQRNRIIAGLSDVLFLPEAGKKSWSLITVEFGLAMKTPVFAPPSSIFSPTSEGILQLMESGHVKPVVDLKRFLHNHFPTQNILSRPQLSIDLSDKEQTLVSLLSHDQGVALPLLVSMSGSDIDELVQLLTMLEIKGIIAQESPGEYVLV